MIVFLKGYGRTSPTG